MSRHLLRLTPLMAVGVLATGSEHAAAQFRSTSIGSLAVEALTIEAVTAVAATTSDACASVGVSWQQAAGADSYLVEVSRDNGAWTTLVTDTGDVRAVTDEHVAGASHVAYRVQPRDASSGWSGPPTTVAITCP